MNVAPVVRIASIVGLFASTAFPAIAQTRLSSSDTPGGSVQTFFLTPDGSRVTFTGDLTTTGVIDFYSASTAASGTQFTINNPAPTGGNVADEGLSQSPPNEMRAIYMGDLTTDEVVELYSASTVTPGLQIKLNSNAIAGGDVSGFKLTPDRSRVLYSGDLFTDGVPDLFSASAVATGTQIRLNNSPVPGGGVTSFLSSPDSTRAFFTGDLTTDTVIELYSASTTALGTQIKLNDTPVSGGGVESVVVSPDSSRVIYSGNLSSFSKTDVYSASVSAAGTQIQISTSPAINNLFVLGLTVTPDGSRAIYLSAMTTSTITEIYSASTTAPGTQITLNDPPVTGGRAGTFFLTPDGSRVVYRGDLTTDTVTELYSASASAAGTQITLSDPPVGGGDVFNFQISPDGARVAYIGDLDTDGIDELYGASTSTAGTQIRLTNFPVTSEVTSFLHTPDSTKLVFAITDLVDGESLWVVDALGASAPVRLSPAEVHSVDIDEYKVTGDSGKVVFSADLDTDGIFALYSASLVPSVPAPVRAPVLRISGKKVIKTSASRVTIKGTAASAVGILRVDYKVPGSRFKKARGTTAWKAFIRPTKRSTPVMIRAIGNDGQMSGVGRITIKKK